MNKITKITGAIGGVVIAALVATGGVIISADNESVEENLPSLMVIADCPQGEVSLDLKYNKEEFIKGNPIERVCLTSGDYLVAKQSVVSAFDNKAKGYDFDINDRDVVNAIIVKEAKEQGKSNVLLSGNKDQIINLLR